MCSAETRAAVSGGLARYSDKQVVNGVCEFSQIDVDLVSKGASDSQQETCLNATKSLIAEFKNRFPDHDIEESIDHC